MSRYLTTNEIDYILDFIKPQEGIPEDTAICIINKIKRGFEKQLQSQKVYPKIIPELKKEIMRQYRQSKIQAGESIGVVCAQSIGEKQTQTSVAYDEKILLFNDDGIISTTIGEYIDKEMSIGVVIKTDHNGYYKKPSSKTHILTVGQDEKISWKPITELSKHPPMGDLIKVTTQTGRTVVTTLSHSHLKKQEDKIVPVCGSELRLGDRIPVIKKSPKPSVIIPTTIKISDYINVDNTKLTDTIEITELFTWFLGVYLAKGCSNMYHVSITNIDLEYENDIYNFTNLIGVKCTKRTEYKSLTDDIRIKNKESEKYQNISYLISNRILASLLEKLCGTGPYNKKIPSFVFGLSNNHIAALIRGWMDINGNIHVSRKCIRGFSMNRNLLEQFSILFTYFGILGTIKLQSKNSCLYEYYIYGKKYCKIYLEHISSNIQSKRDALLLISEIEEEHSNRDELIPYHIGRHITKVSKYLNIRGYNYLGNMIKQFEANPKYMDDTISSNIKYIYQSYYSDIVWDKITNIEIITEDNYQYKYVYDFSIKDNETFALQSGILVHNTLNSVDWKEYVLYAKKEKIIVEPIGQMIDFILAENQNNIKYIEENRTEYLELDKYYSIPACDNDGYTSWYKIEAITRHLPVGDLVKISTKSGRVVTATQSKSFLVWNGDKFEGVNGCDVKVGDILPTTCELKQPFIQEYFDMETIFPKNKYLYTTEIVKARELRFTCFNWWSNNIGKKFILPYKRSDTCFGKRKDFFLSCKPGYIYLHTSNGYVSHIPDKLPLDNDFGFFVGLYLAEGLCTKTFVGISNNDPVIRKRITDYCDRYNITYHLVTSEDKNVKKGTSNDLKIHSVLLARLFKIICDTGSENKRIPEFAYIAPKQFIQGLIDGYYSGDGCVQKDGNITVGSVSEKLILGISFLLSYFGVFGRMSSCQQKKNNVGSKNIKRIYNLRISNGYAQQFARSFTLTEAQKQERLQTITLIKEYRYENGRNQEMFKKDRNVYFDPVVSVEYVKGTTEYVYDLTVEHTRNFQLYNGLGCMDTFHKAGQSEKTMTAGVPRLQELLNATKNPRIVNHIIYLNNKNNTIKEIRKTVGHTIVGLSLKDISEKVIINMDKTDEFWYDAYKILYGDEFTKYNHCITFHLNMKKLYEYKLTLYEICNNINNEYNDLYCVFSPSNIGQIDVFVDISNITLPVNRLLFIDNENAPIVYLEECVQPTLEKMCICGIQGITEVFYTKNNDEWIVETNGFNSKNISKQYSSFKKILAHPDIDYTRTISNNVWDIYETLDVEAARQFLIEEFTNIMEGINPCHILLLVDRMTYNGTISSISRYTLKIDECGPMGKASFEESLDNFLNAAAQGQCEPTRGVSASIICGKRANIGTGMSKLTIDIPKLPNILPVVLSDITGIDKYEMKNKNKNNNKDLSSENELDNWVLQFQDS